MWQSGRYETMLSSGQMCTSTEMLCKHHPMLRWVIMTHFGAPVVPEV